MLRGSGDEGISGCRDEEKRVDRELFLQDILFYDIYININPFSIQPD